ncbi:MAG: undecaprenyl-diphosphate phosphatase [Bacteroidales bacterium]|nr:undecaprenyl-diphosphate phosphatase [Bacteroidales bacterium]
METFEAFILGLIQGLTEFLPVSSSGHITIASTLFGIQDPDTILPFTVVVHVATVLSTIIILWKEIVWIFKGLFNFKDQRSSYEGSFHFLNDQQNYVANIIISMIPIGIIGLCFKDYVEAAFSGVMVVSICLLITALLLTFSYFAKPRQREHITIKDSFIIGLAQACACLPGLSRSGSTIATGLILGDNKQKLAQFSFLMVIPPILGEALLDVIKIMKNGVDVAFNGIPTSSLIVGFISAFIFGCIACKLMINLVKNSKLIYFAIYCAIVGLAFLIYSLM